MSDAIELLGDRGIDRRMPVPMDVAPQTRDAVQQLGGHRSWSASSRRAAAITSGSYSAIWVKPCQWACFGLVVERHHQSRVVHLRFALPCVNR